MISTTLGRGEALVPPRPGALAHPLRLELLDYLDDAGAATATECAAAAGQSVASCSYHLRMLAEHGYIESAERSGREKPWKVVSRNRTQGIDPDAAGSVHAVTATAATEVDRQLGRIRSWLNRSPDLPLEDVMASAVMGATF